jgi:adenine phosphoribosyltransferase
VLQVTELDLAGKIRDVPDFPKKGILFKDITTLLRDPAAFRESINRLAEEVASLEIDTVVGMESRGFIFGAPLAYVLGTGFVPVRKLGKLPAETVRVEYALEYGTNTLELHVDALSAGERVLVVDDLLATGGTVAATIQLVERLGAQVVASAFLVELSFLNGRAQLPGREVISIITY